MFGHAPRQSEMLRFPVRGRFDPVLLENFDISVAFNFGVDVVPVRPLQRDGVFLQVSGDACCDPAG